MLVVPAAVPQVVAAAHAGGAHDSQRTSQNTDATEDGGRQPGAVAACGEQTASSTCTTSPTRTLRTKQVHGGPRRVNGPKAKRGEPSRQPEASGKERQRALDGLRGGVWRRAQDREGSREVQRAFTNGATRELELELLKELHGRVMKAIHDRHANWVILNVLSVFPPKDVEFIFTELRGKSKEVACHQYGCRIMLQLINKHGIHPLVKQLFDEAALVEELGPGSKVRVHGLRNPALDGQHGVIEERVEETGGWLVQLGQGQFADLKPQNLEARLLFHDEFGRHVAEVILKRGTPWQRQQVVQALQANLIANATDKRASYVIETILNDPECKCSTTVQREFAGKLLEAVKALVKSNAGCYVLGTLWEVCPESREQVLWQLQEIQSAGKEQEAVARLLGKFCKDQ